MEVRHVYLSLHRITAYIDQMKAWYDVKTKAEQVNRTLFQKLQVRLLVDIINFLCVNICISTCTLPLNGQLNTSKLIS